MDGLTQITTGVKPGLDRPRFWDLGGGGIGMEMVIDDRIFDVSGETLFYGFTMGI